MSMSDPRGSSPMISARTVERAFRGIRSHGPELLFRVAMIAAFFALARTMLIPLLLGGVCAIALRPLAERLEQRLGRAARASPAIVTVLAVFVLLIPLSWLLWSGISALNSLVSTLLSNGTGAAEGRIVSALTERLGASPEDEQALTASLNQAIHTAGNWLGQRVAGVAQSLPQAITDTFLFVLALYFGLRDGPRLIRWMRHVSPVTPGRTEALFDAIRRSVKGTLFGMLAVAGVQGTLALLAMLVCRVPHALLWGFVASICSAIPIIGTTPVTLGSAGWLYFHDRPLAAVFMLIAAVLIGLSDNIVRPWVQSQHDDVHPLMALVAIFGGLAALGPVGLLFGPVLASMAVWAVETYRDEEEEEPLKPGDEPGIPSQP